MAVIHSNFRVLADNVLWSDLLRQKNQWDELQLAHLHFVLEAFRGVVLSATVYSSFQKYIIMRQKRKEKLSDTRRVNALLCDYTTCSVPGSVSPQTHTRWIMTHLIM